MMSCGARAGLKGSDLGRQLVTVGCASWLGAGGGWEASKLCTCIGSSMRADPSWLLRFRGSAVSPALRLAWERDFYELLKRELLIDDGNRGVELAFSLIKVTSLQNP